MNCRTRLVRSVVATVLTTLALPLTAGIIDPAVAGPLHAEGEKPARLELVMDASGSMKEPAQGGITKIRAAKKALGTVVKALPPAQEVGLRVYGASVYGKSDPGACTDSQLVTPIGTQNRLAMIKAVNAYRPYGETPIGYALQQAGKDLGTSGPRTIVLVSDGIPTCQPDPCEVARTLAKQGIDLRIDVVGLAVNSAARSALQCIAEAGHGQYYDASSADQLTDYLMQIQKRSARPYQTVGKPVTGSLTAHDAPEITAGDWLDTTGDGKAARYYKIKRSLPGSTIIASATYALKGFNSGDILTSLAPDDSSPECSGGVGAGLGGSFAATAAAVSSFDTSAAACMDTDSVLLKVAPTMAPAGVPVEIRVTEHGKLLNASALPPASQATWKEPVTSTDGGKVSGGTSFADAQKLTPGVYHGEIVPGETLTFAVDATWGQQLSATANFPKLEMSQVEVDTLLAHLNIFAPSRMPADAGKVGASAGYPNTNAIVSTIGGKLGTTTAPINFRNLATARTEGAAAEAGTYTIALHLNSDGQSKGAPRPFDLRVDALGTPTTAPRFETTSEGSDGDEAPSDAASPASSDHSHTAADKKPETSTDDAGGLSPASYAIGGAGVATLAAAGGVILVSRLRRR